jgi:hypothetical protein
MFFTCRDLARNLDRLDDPTVPAWHRWLGRAHLASCRHCAQFVRQYRATVLALSKLAAESPQHDEPGLTAFRQWRRRA